MSRTLYRFEFPTEVPIEEIEGLVVLALVAAESLHGASQTRLDAAHFLDLQSRRLVIEADTVVGQDLCKLFTGFALGEFGPTAFRVERVPAAAVPTVPQAVA